MHDNLATIKTDYNHHHPHLSLPITTALNTTADRVLKIRPHLKPSTLSSSASVMTVSVVFRGVLQIQGFPGYLEDFRSEVFTAV
ncbi:hypothetical protein Hanom_Chr02g00142501 [Helianthus anomalus]